MKQSLLAVVLFSLFVNPSVADEQPADEQRNDIEIRFNRDIRPLLSDKCFACHGPDAENAAAGLRLDLAEEAIDAGAIVPGEPSESELVDRILTDDEDMVMPPADSHKELTASERELLVRWIEQGAKYEAHWAYAPMLPRPEGRVAEWIDELVEQQWASARERQQQTFTPAAPADRVTLIRRLSMDLTGIPPTADEVDAFVRSTSPSAYTDLIDRLLASERFGERMASYWLDLVRYADTVGYHGDQNVTQWAFRDYVINAFNENLPYDQFIREQLAGDLLPLPTKQQLIASGYNRLNQTTEEGGAQAKEYLAIYFADRVRNSSQVFMGSTLGCAQCHDHKYDPFTAKDFYAFGAFFADLDERGVYTGRGARPPVMPLPSPEQQRELDEIHAAIEKAKSDREELKAELIAGIDDWAPVIDEGIDQIWVDDTQRPKRQHQGGWNYVTAEDGHVHVGDKARYQHSDALVQHFVQNASDSIEVNRKTKFFAWVYLDPKDPPSAIMLQYNDGNGWSHRAVWGSDDIVYGHSKEDWDGYHRMGQLPETGKWVRLSVDAIDVGLPAADSKGVRLKSSKVNGMAFTQFGGSAWWDESGWREELPDTIIAAWHTPSAERTPEQLTKLHDYYLASSKQLLDADGRIKKLENALATIEKAIPSTVISRSVQPRTIRILPRGNWMDDSGEIVEPAVPEFLGKLDVADRRPTRLDLADWLCRADNPLTARTMVNRLWSLMFGRGICTSVDDFGGQGTYPSNPDLLDALAVEFIESGWDIKHIMRSIAESKAYQLSSVASSDLQELDPYNDLFARQGRFRIDAEFVRDTALSVSGLLVEKVGGASVRPYQPEGYYAQLNFPKRKYVADQNDEQYRRGVYTHWQRTFLHPMLKAFDAPSREECTAQRARSSTPLQSLTLLNDPSFVEAARVFATRVMDEADGDTQSRIDWAYRNAVAHAPDDEIVSLLAELYDRHLTQYRDDPAAAERLLAIGMTPVDESLDPVELAAWTSVTRTILNLHETMMRY